MLWTSCERCARAVDTLDQLTDRMSRIETHVLVPSGTALDRITALEARAQVDGVHLARASRELVSALDRITALETHVISLETYIITEGLLEQSTDNQDADNQSSDGQISDSQNAVQQNSDNQNADDLYVLHENRRALQMIGTLLREQAATRTPTTRTDDNQTADNQNADNQNAMTTRTPTTRTRANQSWEPLYVLRENHIVHQLIGTVLRQHVTHQNTVLQQDESQNGARQNHAPRWAQGRFTRKMSTDSQNIVEHF